MIEKLTDAQEAMLPVYKDKWLKIGLSTELVDRTRAETFINKIYKENNYGIPIVKWFDSPFGIVDHFKTTNDKEIKAQVDGMMKNWIYGNHEAHWLSFYEFFLKECDLECVKKIENFIDIATDIGWWLPFDTNVFASEKPCDIHKKDDGSLHNENGAAIGYRDGVQIYFLNGVKVSKELVMTKAELLDPHIMLKEKNAEIRREIVRKIGIERICMKLGAEVIDKGMDHGDQPCELILLDIGDDNKRPYIKLINPSIGTYHVEGVKPGIKTVAEALEWRNQSDVKPESLS